MSSDVLFRICPYVALIVLGAGLVIRYLLALPRMDVTTAGLTQSWGSYGGSKFLKLTLVLLALAHIVAIAFPQTILAWNGSRDRLYLLEGTGFVIGAVALVGWARMMWRHLEAHHPSKLCDAADSAFVSLVLVGLGTGLLTAMVYRWASSWGAATLTPYLLSLLGGKPTTSYAAEMPFLVQLHMFSAFGALALFPFTRLALFPVVAIHRVFVVIGRPLTGATKSVEEWLRRHNPSVWIWPKED